MGSQPRTDDDGTSTLKAKKQLKVSVVDLQHLQVSMLNVNQVRSVVVVAAKFRITASSSPVVTTIHDRIGIIEHELNCKSNKTIPTADALQSVKGLELPANKNAIKCGSETPAPLQKPQLHDLMGLIVESDLERIKEHDRIPILPTISFTRPSVDDDLRLATRMQCFYHNLRRLWHCR